MEFLMELKLTVSKEMKIGIVTPLTTDKKAGIGVYVSQLVKNLQKQDKENIYYIFTFPGNRHMFEFSNKNFNEIVIQLGNKIKNRNIFRAKYYFWQKFILPIWSKKINLDLIHIPSTWFIYSNSFLPKQVITIHDLAEFHTNRYGKLLSSIKKSMVKKSIKNADGILTVSDFSRKEILELGGNSVFSIYNGYTKNELSISKEDQEKELDKLNLKRQQFFLFVGTNQKHKNIPTIIKAFKKYSEIKSDYKLVIAGKEDNDSHTIRETIDENGLNNKVILLDYISEKLKKVLISNSQILILISNYEGFGLPILEAQELKTAIICSDRTSLPEVAGKGALKVSNNIDEIVGAMLELTSNNELRERLVEQGEINLERFSWEYTAKKTLEVYKNIIRET